MCLLLYIGRAILNATLSHADRINIRHGFINATPDVMYY